MKVKASASKAPSGLGNGIQRDVARLVRLGVETPRDAADILLDRRRPISDRATCCWAMMVAGNAEVVPDLLVAYIGPSSLTWEIAKALAALADKKIVPLMETLAVRDAHPTVRAASAYVLGYLGSRHSGELLAVAFKEERSRGVRQAMVEAIGRLGGKGAKSAVEAAIVDPSSGVRASACYASGLMGMKHLIPKLTRIAAKRRGWEARAAEDAVAMLRTD